MDGSGPSPCNNVSGFGGFEIKVVLYGDGLGMPPVKANTSVFYYSLFGLSGVASLIVSLIGVLMMIFGYPNAPAHDERIRVAVELPSRTSAFQCQLVIAVSME
jgi:hypothetical protein